MPPNMKPSACEIGTVMRCSEGKLWRIERNSRGRRFWATRAPQVSSADAVRLKRLGGEFMQQCRQTTDALEQLLGPPPAPAVPPAPPASSIAAPTGTVQLQRLDGEFTQQCRRTNEVLMRLLISVDGVASQGSADVRNLRRVLVARIMAVQDAVQDAVVRSTK